MPKNWSEESGQVSKWVVCTCAEVKKGFDLDLKMFPSNVLSNVLFFGRKFHVKWSSGSGVIEKVHSESMVIHRTSSLYGQKVKDNIEVCICKLAAAYFNEALRKSCRCLFTIHVLGVFFFTDARTGFNFFSYACVSR